MQFLVSFLVQIFKHFLLKWIQYGTGFTSSFILNFGSTPWLQKLCDSRMAEISATENPSEAVWVVSTWISMRPIQMTVAENIPHVYTPQVSATAQWTARSLLYAQCSSNIAYASSFQPAALQLLQKNNCQNMLGVVVSPQLESRRSEITGLSYAELLCICIRIRNRSTP